MNKEQIAERLIEEEIYVNQTVLIEKLMRSEGQFFSDVWENMYVFSEDEDEDEETEINEPLEFYAISDFLYEKLRDLGEPVLANDYGYWWGRTCSGQPIIVDGVFQKIAEEMPKA